MESDKKQSFSALVEGEKPVLVDFSAEWCGPCKIMSPILKEIKQHLGDTITILKVDIDKNPGLANQYQVQSVPTLILFKKGQTKWRQSGVMPAMTVENIVREYV